MPGAVDGWQKLADKFGRKKLNDDLASAIRTARDGFPIPEWDALYWAGEVDYLHGDEAATATYLPNDRPPKLGEIFRNPELADSLQAIATHGRDAFYKGEIATKLIEGMKRHNGVMSAQDLSEYSAEWVEPLSTTYRDWTVFELPPNGQGMAALEMLNIMEKFPLGDKDWGFGSSKALHAEIEAKKLAYTDLAKYIGDPRGQKLPVKTLISKEWAEQRAKLIDGAHANCDPRAGDLPPGARRPTSRRRSRRQHGFADPEQLLPNSARESSRRALGSRYRIVVDCSRLIHPRPMRWPATSGRCTPSFRHSRSTAMSASPSASWAAGIRRKLTLNSSLTWSTSR